MKNYSRRRLIQVDFGKHKITGDVLSQNESPRVLVLHGAGNSNRKRILNIAPDATHFVFADLRANDPKAFERVFNQIINLLKDHS